MYYTNTVPKRILYYQIACIRATVISPQATSLRMVPKRIPMKLPHPARIASWSCLPAISSPTIAPTSGPKMTPDAPKNRPTKTPIVEPHTPHLVPPNCFVPHAGTI